MAALEQSRSKLVDELDHLQKKAFTKWVNSHLEKADIEIEDLYQDLRDGSILLLLLELFTGTKLKRERGKMRVHHLQNVQRALSFLTDKQKIRIVGIPVEEIVGGNRKLTLGLVWMLILNFELSSALPVDEDKRPTSPKQVSAKAIKEELLHWSQRATEGYDEVKIGNFHKSWKNGMAFCAIINRHRPDLLDYDDCDPEKPLENLEKALIIAEKELKVTRFLDPEDVNVEKPAEEAILLFVSGLKQAFPDMPPSHRRKGPPVSPEEYTDHYLTLREWIDSRLQLTANRNLPSSSVEVRNLLEEFKKLRSVEDPDKEKEKEQVRTMAAEIRVFELKSKKELGVPQIKELEQGWADAMAGSNEYERVLKEELERLDKLEAVSSQLQSSCQAVSIKLDSMDKRLVLLESEGVSSQDEVTELQGDAKSIKETLEDLESSIQVLKDNEYPGWGQYDEKVSGFWKALSSIRSRLDVCVTSESDAQVLLAEADAKLRGCEFWLVEHGKFSDNQLIVQQKDNYELFKSTQLAETDSVMARVNSTPLPGLDDEVRDLNKRWGQVQEQLQNRVSNLAAISGTVMTFESVKTPLQEWCVTKHEQYSSLPLLETSKQELERQREEFQQMLSEVLAHRQTVETIETLSTDFVKCKEPIQTFADKYARRLKRVSRNFAAAVVKGPSEDENVVSLYEQSEALKGEWERNRDRVQQRIEQTVSLLERLTEFELKHAALMELITRGEELLKSEQPVGKSAQRIEEQTTTCQTFRLHLTDAQPEVDSMLTLGRSIIGEYYTNPDKDTMSQTLTDFISNWSNLLMSWQNWYDELHATGEQSRNLSDQFVELKQAFKAIEPKQKELFPAHVTMDTLESDLKDLQDEFSREVLAPLETQRKIYVSLSSNVHLLTEKDDVERTLERFKALLERAESQGTELSELVDNVSCWWVECEMILGKVAEMREDLCEELPLAGSVPFIRKQDESIQDMLLKVEEMKPKVVRTVKHLMSLTEHEGLIVCKPILQHRDELQQQWKELFEQVESRRDLTEVGRVRLNVYIENRDPFDKWLGEAESQLLGSKWRRVDVLSKDRLVELTESLKVFKMDVEMHNHEMECCESMASKFMEAAKKHQSVLLLYKHKLHPDPSSSQLLPENFFDWETEGLNTLSATPIKGEGSLLLHGQSYHNGLQVMNDDLYREKKRFDRLKGRVTRRAQRFEEAREKRLAFGDALEAVLPKLEETEKLLSELKDGGIGKAGAKSLKEQLDVMELLETEFSTLRSLMDPLNLSAAAWMVREPVDSECEEEEEEGEGKDECVEENEMVQQRYLEVDRGLRNLREELESSLAEAQAFQSAYSSFASWLRDMERKIQKDDPLKLETTDLKSGLAYMKAVSSDILGHTESFQELCRRFETAIELAKGGEESDVKDKLENLESRWNGLQVIHEDIEAIQVTLQLLESFHSSYYSMVQKVDDLVREMNRFSPSAITGEAVDKKKVEFEKLLAQFTSCLSEFDSLLSRYKDLFESPFDQTKFRRSIDVLKEKIQECKKLKDDKNRALKHIITRVKSLEMNWAEFQSWLSSSEDKMEAMDQSLVVAAGGSNLSEQLKVVQALQEDISEHEAAMDSIESLVSSLASYLEPHHMEKLEIRFNNLFGRYRCLSFSSQAYPVQVWIYNRTADMGAMGPCAVLVRLLQTQIQEITRYQAQLETYRPRLTELNELMTSLPDQSDLSQPKAKMADIQVHFSKLSKLADQRNQILCSTLPRLKLYQNSLDTWEVTLKGWEESVLQLAPPSTAVLIIQSTIENIKALQHLISDQEPEFYSLQREAKQMYAGSEDYQRLIEQVRALSSPHQILEHVETRPGQLELQNRLDEDLRQLESLKRKLSDLLSMLNTLSEKITVFNRLVNLLLPWLKEQASTVKELEFTEPVYQVLQSQLEKCQSVRGHLQMKQSQREELLTAYGDISSCLADCDDVLVLKNKSDELQTCWSSLSDQLVAAESHLEPSTKLAKSYETGQEKLQAFVKLALGELTGLGPVPSEPEAVQELKIRIDDLKSEYNGLAPLSAKCVEDGLGLLKYCPDPTKQGQHKGNVEEFQKKWDSVGTMLSDIHQKLTDALMQTQEFQQVAENLDRWVNATQSSLKRLEPVAVRVRLIDPQIEGLKPVIEDIGVNKAAMEQAKVIGQQLLAEATTEERLKIGKKLHSLEIRFYGLDKTTSSRMKELEDALQKATEYEGNCSELSDWLSSQEEQMATMLATPIRSQPLKALVEEAKEFNREVLAREPAITAMSSSETVLFHTDLQTIQKYELRENFIEYLSSPQHSRGPSPMLSYSPRPGTPMDFKAVLQQEDPLAESPVHPQFLDRPGSLEALEAGAKLRNRYRKLKYSSTRKWDEMAQLFQTVVDYESKSETFSGWLQELDTKMQVLAPLATSCEEMKAQLHESASLQHDMEEKEQSLESINDTGTALVDGCYDDLSRDSVRESLSSLNERWGNLCSKLDDRTDKLKRGISLAERYEDQEREFKSWLDETEAKLDRPVSVTGSTSEMQQIVKKLENVQGDIDLHKPQLTSMVTVGQDLETFVLSNAEMTVPSLLLGYSDCQSRYEALLSKLEAKRRGTVNNVQRASQLKAGLSSVFEKLQALKMHLENHEPPHILPDPITEQLHQLETVSHQRSALQSSINELLELSASFHLEEGSELFNLHNKVSATNQDVLEGLQQWQARLQRARDSAVKFDRDYNSFSHWLSDVERRLSGGGEEDEGIRGTVEGAEKQIHNTKELQEDVSAHSQPLQKLMDLGRGLMNGASPEDCVLIGDRLAHIQSNYESLQRHALGKMQTLQEELVKVKEFNDVHQRTLDKLQDQEADLHVAPPVGTDVETVKSQLEDFKEFEVELAEMKAKVTACQLKGKKIKDICHRDDQSRIDTKLDELTTAWNELQSLSVARQQDLENALLRLGQFREALMELLSWIRECSGKLLERKEPGVDVEDLEQQINDLKVLQSEIVSREPSVNSLNDASKKLISSSQEETNKREILGDMEQMNQEWQDLKSLAAGKHLTLSTAHERARVFQADLREMVKRFNSAEEQVVSDWKPHALPSTCQKDLEDHQEFASVVQGLKEPMSNIRAEAEGLKAQASPGERETIGRRMSDLKDRWNELTAALEDKQSLLEEAKASADEFDQKFVGLSTKLNELEKQVTETSAIHSEAEEVKQQLEAHKDLLTLLKQFEDEVSELEGVGGALGKNCVPEDGKTIKRNLAKLRSQYDGLQSSALSRLSDLEEALLTVGKFEEAHQELRSWLGQAWDQLQNVEPIPGQSEVVIALLAKHKVLQKELGARSSSHASVIKAGKELMKTKQGEDRSVLKSKLADLEQEWEGVCQMSIARQQRLDNAYKKLRQFETQTQNFKSWMMKILPTIDESVPVDGDHDTVYELTEAHEAFQNELGSHQKSIDAITSLGEEILSGVVDLPSPVKENLDEIRALWGDICNLSVQKQERLLKAQKASLQFDQGIRAMWTWMEQKETEIELMAPPSEDEEELHQQMQQHKMFEESVLNQQAVYDNILAAGRNLHRLAHPRAEPVLLEILQQLEQKWQGLKDEISSRSEALNSAMLEVHGLQDMIDELSGWVETAEGDMAAAEGLAVGDELESVEAQLNQHETFQEEMAKHQPKMEALNKASKKRKSRVSLTHGSTSNPEITKKISNLDKRWKRLWLRSNERHRQLLEARTRLKDIAMARSFNFDAWCKKFVSWVDQQKLRVSDLFRRFDSNHDGMLTREEFMKGLKASGLAMNQIEMEKIADSFDRNRSGLIDLQEITAILKGQKVHKQFKTAVSAKPISDDEKIDVEIRRQISQCVCDSQYRVVPVKAGQYKFGDSQKVRMVRILRSTVMVRVGGGWEPLQTFLMKNDPCRVSGRTNSELLPGIGVSQVTVKSKVQCAISARGEETKRACEKDPSIKKVTRTLHDGRKETKKVSLPTVKTSNSGGSDSSSPGGMHRTYTGTRIGLQQASGPTTPTRKTSSLSRYMSPPSETHPHVRTPIRSKTPSRHSLTKEKTPPMQLSPERTPPRSKTPTRNGNLDVTPSSEFRPLSRGPTPTPPPSIKGSRIPTSSSRIPTPSSRTKLRK